MGGFTGMSKWSTYTLEWHVYLRHFAHLLLHWPYCRGGAFAEWDFLRGVREKWIPELPSRNVSSEDMYGTCEDVLRRTEDDESIVQEYPDPKTTETWIGPPLDDDFVQSHGDSENEKEEAMGSNESPAKESEHSTTTKEGGVSEQADQDDEHFAEEDDDKAEKEEAPKGKSKKKGHPFLTLLFLGFFGFAIKKVFFSPGDYRRGLGYSSVHGSSASGEAVTMAV